MHNHTLSIIIPCYNCSGTLEEAFNSCLAQDLEDFEIIMVDDMSTDTTRDVIESLKDKHPHVHTVYHDRNKGGGAARNTAVKASKGKYIFCLDGDDVLPERVLSKLLSFSESKSCDGTLFEETRFFSKSTHRGTESVFNKVTERPITIKDMFDSKNGFLARVNFLYTRSAYDAAGGYPEHHGYDTQTFGFRFLEKNLIASVCKGTHYFHRRAEVPSYFTREYNEGKLSLNTYLMYEDIFHLFSKRVQDEIIGFDIFSRYRLGKDNLEKTVIELYAELGAEAFFRSVPDDTLYLKGIRAYRAGKYEEGMTCFKESARDYPYSKILWYNLLRCMLVSNNIQLTEPAESILFQAFKQPPPHSSWKEKLKSLFSKTSI